MELMEEMKTKRITMNYKLNQHMYYFTKALWFSAGICFIFSNVFVAIYVGKFLGANTVTWL